MFIELDELNIDNCININEEVKMDSKIDKRIHDLKDAFVKGVIRKNSNGDILIECNFKGKMQITDSVTLDLIYYDFDINISENLDDLQENYQDVYEKGQNRLDLKQILWQNIVLEVPISFTICNDADIKGNGWELIKEDKKSNEVDPRLQELQKLLKGDD